MKKMNNFKESNGDSMIKRKPQLNIKKNKIKCDKKNFKLPTT